MTHAACPCRSLLVKEKYLFPVPTHVAFSPSHPPPPSPFFQVCTIRTDRRTRKLVQIERRINTYICYGVLIRSEFILCGVLIRPKDLEWVWPSGSRLKLPLALAVGAEVFASINSSCIFQSMTDCTHVVDW